MQTKNCYNEFCSETNGLMECTLLANIVSRRDASVKLYGLSVYSRIPLKYRIIKK